MIEILNLRSTALCAATALLLCTCVDVGVASGEEKGLLRNVITTFAPPSPEEQRSLVETVGMSEEQKAKLRSVNERYRNDAQRLRAKYDMAYENVVLLMNQQNPNKSRVNQTLKNFHSVHQEMVNREVGYWMDFKSILTPEQNRKFWNAFEQKRVRR